MGRQGALGLLVFALVALRLSTRDVLETATTAAEAVLGVLSATYAAYVTPKERDRDRFVLARVGVAATVLVGLLG